MEQKIEQLERDIADIKERNKRVESDKAWERSMVRIAFIMVLTYVSALVFLYAINAENIFLNALVPTIGFFLSIQSLPFIKKWWINKNLF